MRVAISGSHRTGKTTLVSALSRRLPRYETVDEPYHLLEEDGYEFAHPPELDDFEAQLERSIEELTRKRGDVLFDRCPLDIFAYFEAYEADGDVDFDEWLPRVRTAVETLDLVVFVPVESPDRISFSAADDDDDTRLAVHEALQEIVLDDRYDLGLETLEVTGDVESRVRTVLERIRRGSG